MASQWTRANSAEKKVPHTRIEDESDIQVKSLLIYMQCMPISTCTFPTSFPSNFCYCCTEDIIAHPNVTSLNLVAPSSGLEGNYTS